MECPFCDAARLRNIFKEPLSDLEFEALCPIHLEIVRAVLDNIFHERPFRLSSDVIPNYTWACSALGCHYEGYWATGFVFALESGKEFLAGSNLCFCKTHKAGLLLSHFLMPGNASSQTLVYQGRLVDLYSAESPPARIAGVLRVQFRVAEVVPQEVMRQISLSAQPNPGRRVW